MHMPYHTIDHKALKITTLQFVASLPISCVRTAYKLRTTTGNLQQA